MHLRLRLFLSKMKAAILNKENQNKGEVDFPSQFSESKSISTVLENETNQPCKRKNSIQRVNPKSTNKFQFYEWLSVFLFLNYLSLFTLPKIEKSKNKNPNQIYKVPIKNLIEFHLIVEQLLVL